MHNDNDFMRVYRGSFCGVLRWPQLDQLWSAVLAAPQGWFVYAVGEAPPVQPAEPEELRRFVTEIDALLRRDHAHDYCGIVYADDLRTPRLIKIYDPNNLGSVCGSGPHGPPPPGWIVSTLPPAPIDALQAPDGRRRWWERLWNKQA